MDNPQIRRPYAKYIAALVGGMLVSCLLLGFFSWQSNRNLPPAPADNSILSSLDKARLQETLHLKSEFGNKIWQGFGDADIPVMLWNEDYAFLIGHDSPPGDWEPLDDDIAGTPYFRKQADNPQNFTELIGDQWTAVMATKYETDQFLMGVFREILPPIIEDAFPYRFLVQPSEVQIAAVIHEGFHAYQAVIAVDRFNDAESAYVAGDAYWRVEESMRDDWKNELEFLHDAVEASTDAEARMLARKFITIRTLRRQDHKLTPELIQYEQRFEWLEGLAKYTELEIWRRASTDRAYTSLPGMAEDPDFQSYQTFEKHWGRELNQLKRPAGSVGDTRFYYTGMAQAVLLDRLLPGWKEQIFQPGVFLDDLLLSAINQ